MKLPIVIVAALLAAAPAAVQPPDAEAHRAWMNDASDAQEDLREALTQKDREKISAGATKMESLMAQTERYWSAKKAADVVALAQQARAQAKQVGAAGQAGTFDEAQQAFTKLGTTCNSCHELHPEKR